jgi:hypothetical protein
LIKLIDLLLNLLFLAVFFFSGLVINISKESFDMVDLRLVGLDFVINGFAVRTTLFSG